MTSFRCRHGFHSWKFESMKDARRIDISWHTAHVCTLTEKCRRCGLVSTRAYAPIPKRVKS